MKPSSNTADMTKGSPVRLILTFSVPLIIGNIFQQFYNMVDSIVVGNFVGANALGAVGAGCSSHFHLVLALELVSLSRNFTVRSDLIRSVRRLQTRSMY